MYEAGRDRPAEVIEHKGPPKMRYHAEHREYQA